MSVEEKLAALRAKYHDDVIEQFLDAGVRSGGLVRIALERLRQIETKGHTAAHDDEHVAGEIAAAASAYIAKANGHSPEDVRELYPWDGFPKSTDRCESVAKAGALTAAELDRLDRAWPADEREAMAQTILANCSIHIPFQGGGMAVKNVEPSRLIYTAPTALEPDEGAAEEEA